jgi:hypothetical protein
MLRPQVVQDVPEPPVHLFQDGHVLLSRPAPQPAQPAQRVVHPRVTGRRRPAGHRLRAIRLHVAGGCCFSHGPFGIKVLIFVPCTLLACAAAAAGE